MRAAAAEFCGVLSVANTVKNLKYLSHTDVFVDVTMPLNNPVGFPCSFFLVVFKARSWLWVWMF